jgi:HlyD family secretion protein
MPAPSEKGGRAILWGPLLVAAIVVSFALGGGSVYYYLRYYNVEETPDTSPEPSAEINKVVALGRIEPRDGVLPLGLPTPDRIREIPKQIQEGATVKQGETLVILDSQMMRELERKLAVIQREQAEKRLKAIEENGNAQIHVEELRRDQIEQLEGIESEALESKIEFLKAQEKNTQKDYERYVAAGDTIAKQDIEKQSLAYQQVRAERIASESQLKKLHKSTKLNLGVANAQLKAAEAELKQSQSAISPKLLDTQVQQAEERLKDTKILAPSNGKILRIFKHQGELVRGEPILEMANVDHMIVLAEVYETDIERVKPGQEAIITSNIFEENKNPLKGEVIWIAGSVGRAQVVPLDPRAAVDNRVVDVKIKLKQPERVADLIGHQVRVIIKTGPAEVSR